MKVQSLAGLVLTGVFAAGAASMVKAAGAETPAIPLVFQSAGGAAAQGAPNQDAAILADLTQVLKGKRLKGVTPQVQNGVVTLTGTVEDYQDKLDAGKKAQKVHGIGSLQNDIQVGGPQVSDEQIGQKLAGKLAVDGLNVNLTQFEYFGLNVQNGIVTLKGFAVYPAEKDWAMGEVATLPGVKGIVDQVQVAPPSPNDDQIRRATAAAIYGYSMFTKYAINPEKPIRILVLNGNVTLVGVVNSKSERDVAYMRANGVGGAFKVTNDLQVEGTNER